MLNQLDGASLNHAFKNRDYSVTDQFTNYLPGC